MFKIATSFAFLMFVVLSAAPARADLNGFLSSLNVQAQADLPGFQLKISTQFGVPLPQVQTVVRTVSQPADAFMIFQLGQMSSKPPETVVQTYQANRTKGWGAIAHELGIKPGSPEFHALKNGDLAFTGVRGSNTAGAVGAAEAPGKGRGKGHKK
jgi:hypothetical protein